MVEVERSDVSVLKEKEEERDGNTILGVPKKIQQKFITSPEEMSEQTNGQEVKIIYRGVNLHRKDMPPGGTADARAINKQDGIWEIRLNLLDNFKIKDKSRHLTRKTQQKLLKEIEKYTKNYPARTASSVKQCPEVIRR